MQTQFVNSILKNKIIIYLVTRYVTYGLQFIISLIIAVRLGPYYLGVYGLVNLILSYFGQINLGIPHSLNVLLIHNKNDIEKQERYILNSAFLLFALSFLIMIAVVLCTLFDFGQFCEYAISAYIPFIIAIAILTYFNSLVTTVIRFRNKVQFLSVIGTIPVLLSLAVVPFFRNERLVLALVCANLFSSSLILLLGIISGVFKTIRIENIRIAVQNEIIKKGFYLFFYNSCFYFILIVVRTIISSNYSIEEFGFFTFSFTIANAVMLLLDSLNIIVFPKTIDLLSHDNVGNKLTILNKLRVGYITLSHLLVYFAILLYPIFVLLFPQYSEALTSMNMVSLAILMNTNSYGYVTLLIAQNREYIAARISLIALTITIVVGLFMVKFGNVEFSYVILSMLIAYLLFSFIAAYEGNKVLGCKSFGYTLHHFFPIRLLIPYCVALQLSLLKCSLLSFLPILIFMMLNYNDLRYLFFLASKLKDTPNIIDVK